MTPQETYRARGYLPLSQLLPAEVAQQFLGDLNADLARAGKPLSQFMVRGPLLRKEAAEVYGHAYRPLMGLLFGLTPFVAAKAGAALLPTYAYFRLYQQGDVCRVHADRPACEHSVSLTLAYSDGRPWSLAVGADRVDPPAWRVAEDFEGRPYGAVAMGAGDAVLYRGVHHRHGRLEPNPNRWSAHVFLHWVERDGAFKAEAFDRPTQARVAAQAAAGR